MNSFCCELVYLVFHEITRIELHYLKTGWEIGLRLTCRDLNLSAVEQVFLDSQLIEKFEEEFVDELE